MEFIDPTRLRDWLAPHSSEWYRQLGKTEGAYLYSWNSILEEPNGESLFDREVMNMVAGRITLDIGCGHGDFTLKCADQAEKIIGIDVTDEFIRTGTQFKKPNVSFMEGNTKEQLPFEEDAFDYAYIRKGPTSAYSDLQRVVKKDGKVLGLHPGDLTGRELPGMFPNLFAPHSGVPVLDRLRERLKMSNFAYAEIERFETLEYLETPIDFLKYRCFGQTPAILEELQRENLEAISRIFEEHATDQGLAITFSRYIVRAFV